MVAPLKVAMLVMLTMLVDLATLVLLWEVVEHITSQVPRFSEESSVPMQARFGHS